MTLILFFYEISSSKQSSPRWDAAFCGVTSEAILFARHLRNKNKNLGFRLDLTQSRLYSHTLHKIEALNFRFRKKRHQALKFQV